MQSVEASGKAEVGAVVHDELDACSEARSEFSCLLEHLPGVAAFVAMLEQRDSSGGEFPGSGKHFANIGETRSVENGVESRKLHGSK
jgi:hypothetical protein